jgi:ribonuclease P protein component
VRRNGIRRHAGSITVMSAVGIPGLPRVAVVAGRRVGRAVDRNRAKRRVREAVARVRLRAGHDYVVVAGQSAVEIPFEELVGCLRRAAGAEEES